MPDLVFPDISNYQPDVDFAALRAGYPVLACQISWGTAITVPAGRITAIRAQGFTCVVWYMGLRADQAIAPQVGAFTQTLGPLLPGDAVCIDWEETPGAGTPNAVQREQAATLIASTLGMDRWHVGTYGPASLLEQSPPPSWAWPASYETAEPTIPHVAWQYTDGVYVSAGLGPVDFPGIGKCDASIAHVTAAEFAATVCRTVNPPAPPTPEESMAVSPCLSFKSGQQDVVQVANGELIHWWEKTGSGEWSSEVIIGPTTPTVSSAVATIPDQVPQVSLVGGNNVICVEDSTGNPWIFSQAAAPGGGWGDNKL